MFDFIIDEKNLTVYLLLISQGFVTSSEFLSVNRSKKDML